MKRNNRRKGRRRIEEKNKKTQTLPYLPQELIIQILLRLPVKSLIGFKCVCKSWFSVISDTHYFANSHFQLSSERILLIPTYSPRKYLSIDFDDDGASVSLNPNFMRFQTYYRVEIKGSCRGFLLLHCYYKRRMWMHWMYDIYIWNPSTGFHKKIPFSPFASNSKNMNHYTHLYGFGYDHSTDDYLLVTMSYKQVNYDPLLPLHLEFFSLRANTWKQIECTQFTYRNIKNIEVEQPAAGFLFNGAIHWFAYCHDLQKCVIVAFDLMERKLFNIHLPVNFDHKLRNCGLWVFGEFLGLWIEYDYDDDDDDGDNNDDDFIYNHRLEVWVMKECKVDSPWTKTLVLPFDRNSPKCYPLICSTKSGDIIGTNGGSVLAKYNDQGQLLKHHSYFNNRCGCEVALYVESFFSLPDNERA